MKTKKEIDAEIKALEHCKTYAPHYSMFGADNWHGIDEQIGALANDLSEDDVYDQYDGRHDLQSAVLHAVQWRDGNEDEPASSGWDSFKPKKA